MTQTSKYHFDRDFAERSLQHFSDLITQVDQHRIQKPSRSHLNLDAIQRAEQKYPSPSRRLTTLKAKPKIASQASSMRHLSPYSSATIFAGIITMMDHPGEYAHYK